MDKLDDNDAIQSLFSKIWKLVKIELFFAGSFVVQLQDTN